MKKILLGFILIFLSVMAFSQSQGLDRIIVEKYYVANAADNAHDPNLAIGAVTYRIFVDMKSGWKLSSVYASPGNNQRMLFKTSAADGFYNQTDDGGSTPTGITYNKLKTGTLMLDSWVSLGAAAKKTGAGPYTYYAGIPKTDDNATNQIIHTDGLLQNISGYPSPFVKDRDGIITVTTPTIAEPTFSPDVAPPAVDLRPLRAMLENYPSPNTFSTTDGAWYGDAVGPTSDNIVLIGQFTTEGVFEFRINLQLLNPTTNGEEYLVNENKNPADPKQILTPALHQILGAPLVPPLVTNLAVSKTPTILGDVVELTVSATDNAPGTVTSVEFFRQTGTGSLVSLGSGEATGASTYSRLWTSDATGTFNIIARATDNDGAYTDLAAANLLTVNPNQIPVVNTLEVTPSTVNVGAPFTVTATVTDPDQSDPDGGPGVEPTVDFFINNIKVGSDSFSPYVYNGGAPATEQTLTIKAIATDDRSGISADKIATLNVINPAPVVTELFVPASPITTGSTFAGYATATDNGSIANIKFYVNNEEITNPAPVLVEPGKYSFIATAPSNPGTMTVKAVAYDNLGKVSLDKIETRTLALDQNSAHYTVVSQLVDCNVSDNFFVPIATRTKVENVIGFDMVIHYDPLMATPVFNSDKLSVRINGALIDASKVEWATYSGTAGSITISLFLKEAANNTYFTGQGEVLAVEFMKKGAFGPTGTTTFTVDNFVESYNTRTQDQAVLPGTFATELDNDFYGTLRFWLDKQLITSANSLQTNISSCAGTGTTNPTDQGVFHYITDNGPTIKIIRDIDPLKTVFGVIGGMDAYYTQRVIVGDPTYLGQLTVDYLIPMDVNKDGKVSAGDVTQILQRGAGAITEFKQQWNYNDQGQSNGKPSLDWVFIDNTTHNTQTYQGTPNRNNVPNIPECLGIVIEPNSGCPTINDETFLGYMLGDVDGNYKDGPEGSISGIKGANESKSAEKVLFDLAKSTMGKGEYLSFPVMVTSDKDVNALDFAMTFDNSKIAFDSYVSHVASLQAVAHYSQNDQTLRFTSFSLKSYSTDSPVVTLRFELKDKNISEEDLKDIKAYVNGKLSGVEVTKMVTTGVTEHLSNEIKVYPNPVSIILNVEVPENASVQLLDLNGRVVLTRPDVDASQKLELNVEGISDGAYILKISMGEMVITKKVIIRK